MSVYKKINLVMNEVQSVLKGASIKMGGGSYKAVLHDDVTRALRPSMIKHNIVMIPTIDSCEAESFEITDKYGNVKTQYLSKVFVKCKFVSCDDESEFETKSFAYSFDSGDKGVGKAYSMAVKYALLKTFMLESLDEEEMREQEQYNLVNLKNSVTKKASQITNKFTDKEKIESIKNALSLGDEKFSDVINGASDDELKEMLLILEKL